MEVAEEVARKGSLLADRARRRVAAPGLRRDAARASRGPEEASQPRAGRRRKSLCWPATPLSSTDASSMSHAASARRCQVHAKRGPERATRMEGQRLSMRQARLTVAPK
eukprot:246976-Rhodomonas_salina.2